MSITTNQRAELIEDAMRWLNAVADVTAEGIARQFFDLMETMSLIENATSAAEFPLEVDDEVHVLATALSSVLQDAAQRIEDMVHGGLRAEDQHYAHLVRGFFITATGADSLRWNLVYGGGAEATRTQR